MTPQSEIETSIAQFLADLAEAYRPMMAVARDRDREARVVQERTNTMSGYSARSAGAR